MQCAECGKILKGPGSLKSHMNMHADLRWIIISENFASFKIFNITGSVNNVWLEYLYSYYNCISNFYAYLSCRPYPCLEEGCGKRFRVKNKLALHMMIHRGDKKEQCRFCGRLFYFAKDLARHERMHKCQKLSKHSEDL